MGGIGFGVGYGGFGGFGIGSYPLGYPYGTPFGFSAPAYRYGTPSYYPRSNNIRIYSAPSYSARSYSARSYSVPTYSPPVYSQPTYSSRVVASKPSNVWDGVSELKPGMVLPDGAIVVSVGPSVPVGSPSNSSGTPNP